MTDEQSVERALHWMMENSSKLAQSVANRKYLEGANIHPVFPVT